MIQMTCGKQMFVSCMDKHAQRKLKRISKKRAPWITKGLLNKMHRTDLIKKKAISSNDHDMWKQFKCARNQANNATKAKGIRAKHGTSLTS